MGGKAAMVNMGLSVIPPSLLIPGIFIMSGFAALTLGTSTGAQAAFIPVGVAVAQAADLSVAAAGAARSQVHILEIIYLLYLIRRSQQQMVSVRK